MKSWLLKNSFWILAAGTGALSLVTIVLDNFLASLAFFLLFVFSMIVGVYYANIQFSKDLLTEYDNVVRVQKNRRGLKVIKGGKERP